MKLNKLLLQSKDLDAEIIPTGIASIDKIIGGLRVGHICTMAARPAMGKTALAMSIANNIGVLNNVPTVIISLDNDEGIVVKKLYAAEFGLTDADGFQEALEKCNSISADKEDKAKPTPASEIDKSMEEAVSLFENSGFATQRKSESKSTHLERCEYVKKMKEAPLWIEHNLDFTVDEVISRVERMKRSDKIKVVIIDELSLLIAGMTFIEREQSMLKLAQAAKRLNIAVLMTAGLSRSVEYRGGAKIPALSDLRDGLSVETYSTVIMLIYRPEYYLITEDEHGNTHNIAQIFVAKNKFGGTGEARLKFLGHSRFEDIAEEPMNIEREFDAIIS